MASGTLSDAPIESAADRAAAQAGGEGLEAAWRGAWRMFRSLKFGLTLLAIIAGVCVYGAVGFAANPVLGKNQVSLARSEVFQSHWFAALLGLFAVQLLVSTWHVTVMGLTLWRRREFRRDAAFYAEGASPRAELNLAAPLDKAEALLRGRFTYFHRDGEAIFAHRGLMSRVGPTIVHAGMLIVLGSGMARAMLIGSGTVIPEGRFVIGEGEVQNLLVEPLNRAQFVGGSNVKSRELPDGIQIRLLDFDAETHPNVPDPSFFSSLLEIAEPKRDTGRVVQVDMNHALRLAGMRFHQAAYERVEEKSDTRFDYDVRRTDTGGRVALSDATPGMPARVGSSGLYIETNTGDAGGDWRLYDATNPHTDIARGKLLEAPREQAITIEVLAFFPDAQWSADAGVTAGGSELRRPALRLEVKRDGAKWADGWVPLQGSVSDPAMMGALSDLPFALQFSDIQIRPSETPVDMTRPGNARFVVELRARGTGAALQSVPIALGDPPVGMGWREDARALAKSKRAGGAEYAVFAMGKTARYVSVLTVVREPTIPFTTLGVGVILFGAIMTFISRYRALYGVESGGVLHLALVPRWSHGREAAAAELDGLVRELEAAGVGTRTAGGTS